MIEFRYYFTREA